MLLPSLVKPQPPQSVSTSATPSKSKVGPSDVELMPSSQAPRSMEANSPASVSFLPHVPAAATRKEQRKPGAHLFAAMSLDSDLLTEHDENASEIGPNASVSSFASLLRTVKENEKQLRNMSAERFASSPRSHREIALIPSIDDFLAELSRISTIDGAVAIQAELTTLRSQVEKQLTVIRDYYAHALPQQMSSKQLQKLDSLEKEMNRVAYKQSAAASRLRTLESIEAERCASQHAKSISETEYRLMQEQQEAMRRLGSDAFRAALKHPLLPRNVQSRLRNDLLVPWLLRVSSLSSEQVQRSDALAQWIYHEFLDDYAVQELLLSVPDAHMIWTAKRIMLTFHPEILAAAPPPVASTALAPIQQRSLPDFTKIVLHAIAQGEISTVSLLLSAPAKSCRLEQALLDREMVAIVLYAALLVGHVNSLHKLLKQGFYHSHVIHALLFLSRNDAALTVERALSVPAAAALSPLEVQLTAKSIARQRAKESITAMDEMDDEPVDVDALLHDWESSSGCVTSAGGYSDIPLARSPIRGGGRVAQRPSRTPVSFTQLVASGRFDRLRENRRAQTVPYFHTDCVQKFGTRGFASLTPKHHVAVRGDVPIILPPKQAPTTTASESDGGCLTTDVTLASRYYYYEAHVLLDALTSGEDCVHVGWCDEAFAADGVQPMLLGNDEHSLGISLVAYDTVQSSLHCTSLATSRSTLHLGDTSAASMRSRSQMLGITSRFSASGQAALVPVKHFRGHSQRLFPAESHCVMIDVVDHVTLDSTAPSSPPLGPLSYSARSDAFTDTDAFRATSQRSTSRNSVDEVVGDSYGDAVIAEHDAAAPSLHEDDENDFCAGGYRETREPSPKFPNAIPKATASGGGSRRDSLTDSVRNEGFLPATADAAAVRLGGQVVVFGCLVDVATRTSTFYVNGTSLGICYDSFPPNASLLYPCVSLVQFRKSVAAPTVRFCFEHTDIRYIPVLGDDPSQPPAEERLHQSSVAGSASQPALGIPRLSATLPPGSTRPLIGSSHYTPIRVPPISLFDQEAKIRFTIHFLHRLHEENCAMQRKAGHRRPSMEMPQESFESLLALDPDALPKVSSDGHLPWTMNAAFKVTLNCKCVDRRMYFMPVALINETAEPGAPHQTLDVAVLCCAANPPPLMFALLQRLRGVAYDLAKSEMVDVCVADQFGVSPLLIACSLGYHEVVAAILQRATPDELLVAFEGYIPLHAALMAEHETCVGLLIDAARRIAPMDVVSQMVNRVTPRGNTPLTLACKLHLKRAIDYLLLGGANATICDKKMNASPLLIACHGGAESLAAALLESGQYDHSTVLNTPSKELSVPLCWAAQKGMTRLIPRFRAAGADPSIRYADAQPITLAIVSGNEATAYAIAEVYTGENTGTAARRRSSSSSGTPGTDRIGDSVHNTPRDGSLGCSGGASAPKYAGVDPRFDVQAVDPRTQSSALHLACELNMSSVADILLRHGAMICSLNKQFATPLHVAIQSGHEQLALNIITYGKDRLHDGSNAFDLSVMDSRGDTILHAACRFGMVRVVEKLLRVFSSQEMDRIIARTGSRTIKPLDLVAENRVGDTALMVAVKTNHPEVAEVLLSSVDTSVDLAPATRGNNSQVIVACVDREYWKLAHMLLARGANVTADLRAEIVRKWDSIMESQTARPGERHPHAHAPPFLGSGGGGGGGTTRSRRASFQCDSVSFDAQPFPVAPGRMSSFKPVEAFGGGSNSGGGSGLIKTKSFSQVVASRVSESSRAVMKQAMRRRSTIQRMFRPVAARFDDRVSHKLTSLFQDDELLYEFECIMGMSSMTAPQVVEKGEVLVACLFAHGGVCFSATEASNLAKAGYAQLSSRVTTHNIMQRRLLAESQEEFGKQVFSIIRRFSRQNASAALEALSKALDVYRVFSLKMASPDASFRLEGPSSARHGRVRLPIAESTLTNPFSGVTALQLACSLGLSEVVSFLCDNLELDVMHRGGWTHDKKVWRSNMTQLYPLRIATINNHEEVVQVLLRSQACDSNAVEPFEVWPSGDSILLSAARIPSSNILCSLIACGSALIEANNSGEDIWQLAVRDTTATVLSTLLDEELAPSTVFLTHLSQYDRDTLMGGVEHVADDGDDEKAALSRRNLEYCRRWFSLPFLDTEAFALDPQDSSVASSSGEHVSGLSVAQRSFADAYLCALLFWCVQFNPSYVLRVLSATSLSIAVTHPISQDSLLTFVISEAVNSQSPATRSSMTALARAVLSEFEGNLNVNWVRGDGESALSLATRLGDLDLVQLLLRRGASLVPPKQLTPTTTAKGKPVWKTLAALAFPFEKADLLDMSLQALDATPAVRRAFVGAILPNCHPLLTLRICLNYASDVVSAVSNAAAATNGTTTIASDAALALWLMVHYVVAFQPESTRATHFLTKKVVDSILVPLAPTMPPIALLSLRLLKARQKSVRELQQSQKNTAIQQQQQSHHLPNSQVGGKPSTASPSQRPFPSTSASANQAAASLLPTKPSRRHSGSVLDGLQPKTPLTPVSAMSAAGGSSPFQAAADDTPPALTPHAPRIRRVSVSGHGASSRQPSIAPSDNIGQNFVHDDEFGLMAKTPSEAVLPTITVDTDFLEPSASVREMTTSVAPLNLVSTPASLQLRISDHSSVTPLPQLTMGAQAAQGTSTKAVGVDMLLFKVTEALAQALREANTTPATSAQHSSGKDEGSGAGAEGQQGGETATTMPRCVSLVIDAMEVCVRLHKQTELEQLATMLPPTVKYAAVVKERHFIELAVAAGNVGLCQQLIQSHIDAKRQDTINVATGAPYGIFVRETQQARSHGSFVRDDLLSGFHSARKKDDLEPAKKRAHQPIRFSADPDALLKSTQLLNRRRSYDAAAAAKAAAAAAGTATSDAANTCRAPGTLSPRKLQLVTDSSGSSHLAEEVKEFSYCLFDWAVHAFYLMRLPQPKAAMLDAIHLLMEKRSPPTYQVLQFLLSQPDEALLRATGDAIHWETSSGTTMSINITSATHGDSWLHLLVMHDQVVLADLLLTMTKGTFAHKTRRNAAGLIPADYCTSYEMMMTLQHHGCFLLGLQESASVTTIAKIDERTPQLLVVPRDFLHIFDSENDTIDRKFQLPGRSRSSTFGDSISELHSRGSRTREELVAHGGVQTVSDETILRNLRHAHKYLAEALLPVLLPEASSEADNLRIRPVEAPKSDGQQQDLGESVCSMFVVGDSDGETVFAHSKKGPNPLLPGRASASDANVDVSTSLRVGHRKSTVGAAPSAIPLPISLRMKQQPPSSKPSVLSPRAAARPPAAVHPKSLLELVETLQRNHFLVRVDDLHNDYGVSAGEEFMDLGQVGKVVDRALFVSLPRYEFALRMKVLRLQNHRVAVYDQLDNAVLSGSAQMQRPELFKFLEAAFLELVGTCLSDLGLRVSPRYS